MKRKDFLTKMRNRRRGDRIELREPEKRRAIDWRTLRVELPAEGEAEGAQEMAVGVVGLLPTGIRLTPGQACWVRGYRFWHDDEGRGRAEFQYRPVEDDSTPPPGATALAVDEVWQP